MTAFLKIDECITCRRSLPWEWVPAVLLSGKALAGTGVWRSQLVDHRCAACTAALIAEREKKQHAQTLRRQLVELLGGEKPYREFTLERYAVSPGNRLAYERSKAFNPAMENLYLWGGCGVGKTHLAWAIARRCFEESLTVMLLAAFELGRRVRMKDPEQEQVSLDGFVSAELLVLDDLGSGPNTAFNRQLLQEILDGRYLTDRAGLVITSRYSLDKLAIFLGDDSIPSRLAGMCHVIRVAGHDHRLEQASRL